MRRTGVALAVVIALLGLVTTSQAGNPRAKLRTVELAGTIAVDGTPSAKKPVRFTARLIGDARGVPLLRGGTAVITQGRVYVDTIGTVVSGCLSESSLRLAGMYSDGSRAAAQARGDLLRIDAQRRVALDLDVIVGTALRGSVGPECVREGPDAVGTLQLRGTLGGAAIAPIGLTATTPVTLVDGRRVTMRVVATATIKRYLPPLCVNCVAGRRPAS